MKTKKEKLEILMRHFYNKKTNELDLRGLDFGDMDVNLSNIKANNIWNDYQKANTIYNSHQQVKEKIYNCYQQANEIVNSSQIANDISNTYQLAKDTILNNGQEAKEIWNEYQEENINEKL